MASVAVVTPVFNGERYLVECIESVLAQTFSDWEYIILDNASSDETRKIADGYASKDKRIRVYSNAQTVPMIANFNKASTLVPPGTRYLKFLCADDLLFPECLARMIALAERNADMTLVGSYKICGDTLCGGLTFPQEFLDGKEVCRRFFQGHLDLLGSQTNHLIRLPPDAALATLFDESYIHADTELWLRLLKDGGQFGFVHQVLTYTRVHEEAASEYGHVMGTGGIESLAMLIKHGASFLSERELNVLLQEHRRRESRFRIRSFAKVWDRRPWRFQVARARTMKIDFGTMEMARAAFAELFGGIASPRRAARLIRDSYRRMKDA